jgi:hypothetical protein
VAPAPDRLRPGQHVHQGVEGEDWKERQLQDGLALAERMGGTVAPEDVYTDNVSASRFAKKERDDYLRLLKAIETRQAHRAPHSSIRPAIRRGGWVCQRRGTGCE